MLPLLKHINSIVSFNENEIEEIKSLMTVCSIKKGEYLVKEKDTCNIIAFIKSGFFRIYLNTEHKEVTVHLSGPDEFISSFSSFIGRAPGLENIQALSDAEVLCISYESLQHLYDKSHKVERLGRHIIEQHFLNKEQRVISLITDSAESRYKMLMLKKPQFIQNIPLQHIASFLGVTPETLSRIRAQK